MSTESEVDTQTNTRPRRRYTAAFRRQVVEETLSDAASVSAVARRHDLNTNLVFKWRKHYREAGVVGETDKPALVPIRLARPATVAEPEVGASHANATGRIDLALAGGHRMTLTGTVDAALVRSVLALLT